MSATQLKESKKCRTIFIERSNELNALNEAIQEAKLYEEVIPFIDQQIESMGVDILLNFNENQNTLGVDLLDELKTVSQMTNQELDIFEVISLDISKYNEAFDKFYNDVSITQGYLYAKEYNSYLNQLDIKDMDYYENLDVISRTLNITPSEMEGYIIEAQASINALTEVSQKHDKAVDLFDTLDAALKGGYLAALESESIEDFYKSIKETYSLIEVNKSSIQDLVSEDAVSNLFFCEEKLKIVEKVLEKEMDRETVIEIETELEKEIDKYKDMDKEEDKNKEIDRDDDLSL